MILLTNDKWSSLLEHVEPVVDKMYYVSTVYIANW